MKLMNSIPKALMIASLTVVISGAVSAQQAGAKKGETAPVSKLIEGKPVTGVIKDAQTGKPLAAVQVSIPDYSSGLTDDNGKFTIKVPSYNATLLVSADGFQSKEIALKGRTSITALLQESSFESIYDQAQLPFGSKAQTQTVNALGSINNNGNWERSTETPDGYLQGKVAGLTATMRSGTPNLGAYLSLRGFNSLYTNNQPLIVVDGMVYDITDNGNSILGKHYTNSLADIDVRDIQNITVLKDGVSTYGTKAANGVILITTIHATQLATKIDFSANAGMNLAPKQLPVMEAADYRTYLADVLKSSGMTDLQIQAHPAFNDNVSANPLYYNYHNNTNWQDLVMSNSMSNNYLLKVSGGDNIAKYGLSMGYMKNGSITDNTAATKYNVRFNADLNLSTRLTASTNLAYTYHEQTLKNQGMDYKTNPILLSLIKSPLLYQNVMDAKGVISPNLSDKDTFGISNPVAIINNMIGNSKVYRFFGSVGLKYKLSKDFTINTLGGITTDKVREQSFIPGKGVAPDTLNNAIAINRSASQVKRIFALYNDTYINFAKTYHQIHKINARAGFRVLDSEAEQDNSNGYNSATDEFISVGTGAALLRKVGGNSGKYGWVNGYLGLDYGLQDKYFFSVNVAGDASSRFGKNIQNVPVIAGNKIALMPSFGASWLVSSEKMMANVKHINVLKLRASIAKTGNDDIGNYTAQQTYTSQNLLGVQGIVRANIANPALQWETNTKANAGLDLVMFNERLSVSADLFENKTTNMMTYESLPTATGFDYAITNGGSMKTKGMDVTVSARLINKKQLKWDLGLLVATYKNTLLNIPGGSSLYNYGGASMISQSGMVGNLFYGYATKGVYASDAEAAAAGMTKRQKDASYAPFRAGDVKFVDLNGDKIIDEKDRQVIGNPNPDYTGAITNKISYKAFTLEAICTFSKGNQVYNAVRAALENVAGYENQLVSVNNRWKSQGQITNMPKASWGDPMGNASFSDRWIEDGSFFRLKSLSMSYDLPVKGKRSLKYASVYATGYNLLTLTKYLGYDPEFYSSESVFGKGVDLGLEPQFKSIVLGLRIGL